MCRTSTAYITVSTSDSTLAPMSSEIESLVIVLLTMPCYVASLIPPMGDDGVLRAIFIIDLPLSPAFETVAEDPLESPPYFVLSLSSISTSSNSFHRDLDSHIVVFFPLRDVPQPTLQVVFKPCRLPLLGKG